MEVASKKPAQPNPILFPRSLLEGEPVSTPKAILVNPPNPPHYVSNKDSMGGFGQLYHTGAPPFPPLDMPYLAAVLTQAGIGVRVLEAGAFRWKPQQLEAALDRESPTRGDLIVVRTSLPTIDWDLSICATLRARGNGARVLLYGPVVGALRWRVEQDRVIDYAVVGEPDRPVLELLTGTPTSDVSGLLWRNGDVWHRNAERKFEKQLDTIPFPRWELFPYERYIIPKSATAGEMRFLPMLTSRGCPFGCNYCPYPVGQGLPWRHRSAANVVDEIDHLVRDLGVEYIIFRDPLFSANKKRVNEICDEVVRRGLRVQWRCETRIDCLDEPTIAAMARAGCVGVNFGVESTDPQIQKNVDRKPITEAEFIETVALFRRYGISTFAFFVIGLPGDTIDTIVTTIRFALRLKASWTQFTVATPFIGTRLHDWAVEQGLIAKDHYHMVSSHEGSIGNENLTPAQVHRLHRFAQMLQRNFINRRGILKNERRQGTAYRLARSVADAVADAAGRAFFALGVAFLRRTMPAARRGPATVSAGGQRRKRAEPAATTP